ncbi:uncharacterized protein [Typha angustifolia]|uniref:uncharacterized protein n=1 Tax=Typha angustifolia TaxID=59011 RepID=UPI003C30CD9C
MEQRFRVDVLIILLALAVTVSTICQASVQDSAVPEVYQIDYRGPETHSLPPPKFSQRGPKPEDSWKRDANRQRKPDHD